MFNVLSKPSLVSNKVCANISAFILRPRGLEGMGSNSTAAGAASALLGLVSFGIEVGAHPLCEKPRQTLGFDCDLKEAIQALSQV